MAPFKFESSDNACEEDVRATQGPNTTSASGGLGGQGAVHRV